MNLGINRNIVECKLTLNGCKINWENAELIETLWNVNYFYAKYPLLLPLELIETLWNVNAFLHHCKNNAPS